MRRELMEELEADTTLEDIAEPYRLVVEMIGLKNVLKLSRYFMGDKIYLPKAERILAPARNRRIRREYNGRNAKELAKEYDLTTNQILQIVRDLDPAQISLFEFLDGESGEAGKDELSKMLGLTICFQMDYPMDMTKVMSCFLSQDRQNERGGMGNGERITDLGGAVYPAAGPHDGSHCGGGLYGQRHHGGNQGNRLFGEDTHGRAGDCAVGHPMPAGLLVVCDRHGGRGAWWGPVLALVVAFYVAFLAMYGWEKLAQLWARYRHPGGSA